MLFRKDDYVLSFSVQGINVFITDVHREAYSDLEVLYIIDNGTFNQYFTKNAFRAALESGVNFYSSESEFLNYQKDLRNHCNNFEQFFDLKIKNKDSISKEVLSEFFNFTIKLCKDYTKMNFEYTDKAFTLKEQNKVIGSNLRILSKFKDEVRSFMNVVLFEKTGYLNEVLRTLSKQFDLASIVLENLTQQELLSLFNGVKPVESIILKRQDAFVCTYNSPVFYEGVAAKEIIANFKDSLGKISEVSGQVASKGKVIGRVKLILVNYSDVTNLSA